MTAPKKTLAVAPEPRQASPTESWVAASGNVILRDAPDGRSVATLSAGLPVTVMARDKAWVRVKIDGWVREDSVQLADLSGLPISAAQLHADPGAAKGKTVRWDVQILALETADPLHKDLNPDEPYLLARGPGPESGLLYVAVPTGLMAQARTLAALAPANAHLIATVRVGRSEPVGVPVLDAQSLVRR